MRKVLYFLVFFLTFVSCSVEEDDSHTQKEYVVNDLVEIAKQYGMEFEPLKDIRFKNLLQKKCKLLKMN